MARLHRPLGVSLLAFSGAWACPRTDPPQRTTSKPAPSATVPVPPIKPPLRPVGGGYLLDTDQTVHRAGDARCETGVHDRCQGTERVRRCKTDGDCKAHRGGACVRHDFDPVEGPAYEACDCVYACVTDADCDPGQACVCEEAMAAASPDLSHKRLNGARCAPARCKSAADCGGRPCDVSAWDDECSFDVLLACRGPGDACQKPRDCDVEDCTGRGPGCRKPRTCAFDGQRWACDGIHCMH